MDTEGLSLICAGLGSIEEDDQGNRIGYSKGEYCLGMNLSYFSFFPDSIWFDENFRFLIGRVSLLDLPDNLKDLLRFLRRDDPQTRDVFKQVCKWNIVSKDLIPIIEHYHEDRNLLLNAGFFLISWICIHNIDGSCLRFDWLVGVELFF